MNVKNYKIFGYTLRIEDEDLVDPKLFDIRAVIDKPRW